MPFRLLEAFESVFLGKKYIHRNSTLGDFVAIHLYEDLYELRKSSKLVRAIDSGDSVMNQANKITGKSGRRGDATFGAAVPGIVARRDAGYVVLRGAVATVEIGTETKILAKSMIKQIDRVVTDLRNQAIQFRASGSDPICVAIVGVNFAPYTIGYERDRMNRSDGRDQKHPIQEAAKAEWLLIERAQSHFDELLLLRYVATNEEPYPFEWVNYQQTESEYGAALVRIGREFDRRF